MTSVLIYRGITAGWLSIGKARNAAAADRLMTLARRIRPDYLHKLTD